MLYDQVDISELARLFVRVWGQNKAYSRASYLAESSLSSSPYVSKFLSIITLLLKYDRSSHARRTISDPT